MIKVVVGVELAVDKLRGIGDEVLLLLVLLTVEGTVERTPTLEVGDDGSVIDEDVDVLLEMAAAETVTLPCGDVEEGVV